MPYVKMLLKVENTQASSETERWISNWLQKKWQ